MQSCKFCKYSERLAKFSHASFKIGVNCFCLDMTMKGHERGESHVYSIAVHLRSLVFTNT